MTLTARAPLRRVWPCAVWLALALPAHARAAGAVTISVDAAAAGTPLEPVWPYHGYDELNYTTSAEGKALLEALVDAHSARVHVRSHFLLNSGDGTPGLKWGSTNVYTEDAAGRPLYSWALTDRILDTITAAGASPFVELGFMPEALSSHPSPYRPSSPKLLDGGCFYPPADYDKWAALMRAWAAHAKARYPDAAARWQWELWNEPDIGYWHGTFDEYAKLYDVTEAAIHEVLPEAPLGGPAVAGAGGGFLRDFLTHCESGANAVTGNPGTRLDLITFHAKGGVAIDAGRVEMDLGSQLRIHRAGFEAVAAFPPFKSTPIYITEADPDGCAACPVSEAPENAYRSSPAYGAYELAMMKRTLELEAQLGVKLGGVLTWAFTFPGTPYFAGYRALSTNGIQLPVLGAFQLLGSLSGARLPLTSSGAYALDDVLAGGVRAQPDVDGMATRDGDTIQVLLWSYHDDIASGEVTPIRLTVKLPPSFGAYARVSHLRVDDSHGDAYTTWVAQGMPQPPSVAQVAALQQAMSPARIVPDETVPVTEAGTLALDFDLPRFGVSLLKLTPTTDAVQMDASSHAPNCACRTGVPSADATPGAALRATAVLALVASLRRAMRRASQRRTTRVRCPQADHTRDSKPVA